MLSRVKHGDKIEATLASKLGRPVKQYHVEEFVNQQDAVHDVVTAHHSASWRQHDTGDGGEGQNVERGGIKPVIVTERVLYLFAGVHDTSSPLDHVADDWIVKRGRRHHHVW